MQRAKMIQSDKKEMQPIDRLPKLWKLGDCVFSTTF